MTQRRPPSPPPGPRTAIPLGAIDAAAALAAEIQALTQQLAEAVRLVDSGDIFDMAGLDAEVLRLCAAVQTLSPADAKGIAWTLDDLSRAMNALRAAVAGQRDQVAERLKSVSTRKQAVKAYGVAPPPKRR